MTEYTIPEGITQEVVMVTPALAAEWLQTNTENRKLKPWWVNELVRRIEEGLWTLTNDTVVFDNDGILRNAQHRLSAVVIADITVPMTVTYGLAATTQANMDDGVKRQAHDHFAMLGISGGTNKAALCRAIMGYDETTGLSTSTFRISNPEIHALCQGDDYMDTALQLSGALGRHISGSGTTAITLGYYLLLHAWPEKVPAFHEMLCTGVGLEQNSPILRLRNFLISKNAKQKSALDRRRLLAIFLKCFNAWIDNQEFEMLSWRATDNWPVPFTPASYKRLLAARERAVKGYATRARKAT